VLVRNVSFGLAIAAALLALGQRVPAQSAPRLEQVASIELAEREGASWPRRPVPALVSPAFFIDHSQKTSFTSTLPKLVPPNRNHGRSERKCVEGFDLGPIRSGEFVIGGELGGRMLSSPRGLQKIYWIPLHPSEVDTLVVRGTLLDSPRDTTRFVSADRAHAIPSREMFYPSLVSLPKNGRWLMVATSGPDWGCFILKAP
jgi:hypothetical protein